MEKIRKMGMPMEKNKKHIRKKTSQQYGLVLPYLY